jgi:hypothetical protein
MVSTRIAQLTILLASTQAFAQAPEPLGDPHFDKAIYDACGATFNLELASRMASNDYSEASEASKKGVPAPLAARLKAAQKALEATKGIQSDDSKREQVRKSLVTYQEQLINASTLLADAFRLAAEKKDWTKDANDKAIESGSMYKVLVSKNPMMPVIQLIQSDAEFKGRCPEELSIYFGLAGDTSGFQFGVGNFTDDKMSMMTFVPKGEMAYILGFRSGDAIKSFNGKPIDHLIKLKGAMKEAEGKKVDAVVVRDGKDKTLSIDVPSDLAHFDFDPTTTAAAKEFLQSLIEGKIDRKKLTEECNKSISADDEKGVKEKLAALGGIQSFSYLGERSKDNQRLRGYTVVLGTTKVIFSIITRDGLIAEFGIE